MKYKRIAGLAFVAMFAILAITLPMGVWAEGDDADAEAVTEAATSDACTAGLEAENCSASSYEELRAGLANTNIKIITLTEDITTNGSLSVERGVTIDGSGHSFTTSYTMGISLATSEPVVLDALTVNALGDNSKGIQIYAAGLENYDLTIRNGSVIRGNQYGIYDYSSYYGASGSKLTITDSKLQWTSTDGKTVVDTEKDTADRYAYGLYSLGVKDSEVSISNAEITGYRYAISVWYNAEGGSLKVDNSYISGRTAFDSFAKAAAEKPFRVELSNSKLNGINLWGGASEDYANVIIDWNSETYHAEYNQVKITDVEFTVYENETALTGASAAQYAVTNRTGDVEGTNNTIDIYGDKTSYLVSSEYMSAKKGRQTGALEEDWALAYMTAEQTGIKVYGGTYSYNPLAYAAEGKDVYRLGEDGPYVVDDATTVSLPEETVYVKLGDTMDLGGYLTDIAKKYGTFGVAENAAMTLDKETLVATATKTGTAIINFQLHNYKNEVDKSFSVVVYGIDSEDDANEAGSDEETHNEDLMASATNGVIRALLDSLNSYANTSIENPGSVTLADGTKAEITANATEISRALANGGKVVAKLVEADVALNDTDSAKVKAKMAEGAKVAKTLDYAILLSIDSSNDSTMLGKITETATDLGITVDVSGVEAEEDGYRRAYQVIRLHDGEEEATALGGTYSATDKTVSFASNKFSTFTLAYVDTQVVIDNGDDNTEDVENTETPDTGTFTGSETSVSAGNVVAIVVALAVITAVVVGAVKFAKR